MLPRTLTLALALGFALGCDASDHGSRSVRDGRARFTVLTDTLIRLEYAEDGRFEDRPTQTLGARPTTSAEYTTWVEGGMRYVQTAALTLRYRRGSGPFTADNLEVSVERGGSTVVANPVFGDAPADAESLGGWSRSLDLVRAPVATRPGILSRRGWSLVDDSATALVTSASPGYAARSARTGAYQDGYFFGYGLDYRRALEDLRVLTGSTPLVPRKALGVWFSRYWPYAANDWQSLVADFRAHAVPLDTISVDTDWKAMPENNFCDGIATIAGAPAGSECSWNGWDWNPHLYADPVGFLAWAHGQGLEVGLNVHPSINASDPAASSVLGLLLPRGNEPACQLLQGDFENDCLTFDWGDSAQLDGYFALHRPVGDAGVDFWWLDWCCEDSRVDVPGLSADTWINDHYAREHRRMGSRWPAFSRIGSAYRAYGAEDVLAGPGALAEHRSTVHFTGDTCSTWELLDFVAAFSAGEGAAIGLPYVSHDIGSFHGYRAPDEPCAITPLAPRLPDDMYVRWVELGTFQPLDRLHSQHGLRLPWEYGGAAETIATDFLRLRERLVPYLYTLARQAHDTGMPIVRALYLSWPTRDEAYQSPSHFTLGDGVFVATVAAAGAAPTKSFWLPPGDWYDFFDGTEVAGDVVVTRTVSLDRYPVYVRAGTIVPMQPDLPTSTPGPSDDLTLHIWTGADGDFRLYEDEGVGFGYEDGVARFTGIASRTPAPGCHEVTVSAAEGPAFPGALTTRSWRLRLVGVDAPGTVVAGGQALAEGASAPGWTYDATSRTLLVRTDPVSTSSDFVVRAGTGCP